MVPEEVSVVGVGVDQTEAVPINGQLPQLRDEIPELLNHQRLIPMDVPFHVQYVVIILPGESFFVTGWGLIGLCEPVEHANCPAPFPDHLRGYLLVLQFPAGKEVEGSDPEVRLIGGDGFHKPSVHRGNGLLHICPHSAQPGNPVQFRLYLPGSPPTSVGKPEDPSVRSVPVRVHHVL